MDSMMDRDTLRDLIPAYALGILDADEQRQVEALLAEDEQARQLLADYRSVVEAVALTAPAVPPPASLEQKLLQRARRERARSTGIPRPRIIAILSTVAAVILLLSGAVFLLRTTTRPDAAQVYAHLAEDPQAVYIALVPSLYPEMEGDLVYSSDAHTAVIRASNLPSLPQGQALQLWLVDENGVSSGGVYRADGETTYIQVPVDKPVTTYIRFGVSLEPEMGSPLGNRPSGPRVFEVTIRSG